MRAAAKREDNRGSERVASREGEVEGGGSPSGARARVRLYAWHHLVGGSGAGGG